MHALYRHCIRPMDAKHIQDIQDLVKVNLLGEVRLYNEKITSDALKGLIFPEYAESIDLSRNQITTLEGVRFPEGLQHLNLSQNQITTLEGVRFPEGLQHLNLSRNQITTLEGVTLPSTIITLNLSDNPNLTLTGVNDFRQLGWRKYRSGARMGELLLIGTKVTLEGDLCYMKNIPSYFSIQLNEVTYTNSSRFGNEIKEACSEMTEMTSNPRTFGNRVINLDGGKKRQQTRRRQTRRQQAKRRQTKRRQAKRQSKLKK